MNTSDAEYAKFNIIILSIIDKKVLSTLNVF